jgi:hypothetical protein
LIKDAGVMWEFFWPDIAIDVVKGLVAGGASLAFQVVAPKMLRALRRVRWFAWKAGRDKQAIKAMSPTSSHPAEPIDDRSASAGEGGHGQ